MPMQTNQSDDRRKAKADACARFLLREVRAGLKVTEPHRNVVGIGIAPKLKGGKLTAEAAIRFYVERKFARESDVPPDHMLPKTIHAMPTDVVEIGQMRTASAPAMAMSMPARGPATHVIQPGTSCGVRFGRAGDGATGTIGAIVGRGDKRFLLGSAHVLARINGFLLGSPILCPGPVELPLLAEDAASHGGGHSHGETGHSHDGADGHDAAVPGSSPAPPAERNFQRARLTDFTRLSMSEPNQMDAAIAEIVSSNFDPAIRELGLLTSSTPMEPLQNMQVMKYGLATGLSRGRVIDTDFDGRLSFRQGPVAFENQILIESDEASPFAWEGDSGALVITRFTWDGSDEPVAFAVAQVVGFSMPTSNIGLGRSFCVATPLTPILDRLGVSLVVA